MIAISSVRSQLGAICKNDSAVRPTFCLQVFCLPSIPLPQLLWLQHLGSSPSCSHKNIVSFTLLENVLPELALMGKLLFLLQTYCIINESSL